MRIGIDARYLSHGLVGGVHLYLRHLLPEVIRQSTDHQIVLYADTKRPFELSDLPGHVTLRVLPYRNGVSSVAHDWLTLKRWMAEDRLDVAHFPANYGFAPTGARCVITLHDEINILPLLDILKGHRKDVRTMGMMTYLHVASTTAVRSADLLLTVSGYAQRQIAHYSRLPLDNIVPIYHGRMPDLQRVTDPARLAEVRTRLGVPEHFVLADGIKNPAVLTRAWRRLPPELAEQYRIVFFSRRPDPPAAVTEAVAAGHAVLLVRPERPDLVALFSQAAAFVFPSWIEGFGIPILEAYTCGAPLIASTAGSIPEVAGDAALLMDAEDDATLARHLTRVLGEPELAADLRARGFARAAEFSWSRAAQETLAAYARALTIGRR
ncbi:MAG: glycosyltransferase family 4 protein [Anaerolineales bacterium]|nr:glycosyltransferase family 4 protein [Anaerolineales bacterium]